jgi:methyl-accepting chemotaxis protein-1 (serine sensor receptor)
VQQVDESVTQMETVTQKNASLVDESTASLASVDQQAEQLRRLITFFKTDPRAGTSCREARPANALQSRLKQEFPAAEPMAAAAAERPARPKPAASATAADWSEF